MAKQYERSEVEKLLGALEEQAREVLRLSKVAEKGLSANAFGDYMLFREKISEFEVFSMIIEHRIKNIAGDPDTELQEQLDKLTALILSHLIGASIRFFELMAGGRLPLGSREIFINELKTLYTAREKLGKAKYQGSLTEEATTSVRIAEKILGEIIEMAPGLLNLG